MKTVPEIVDELQTQLDTNEALLDANRGASRMQIRRQLGTILREEVGNDYFVKVRASRDDVVAGRIQVTAVVLGETAELTLQRT
jgi:hypothetical protein